MLYGVGLAERLFALSPVKNKIKYATLTPILCSLCYTYNDTMQSMIHLHRYYDTLTPILCSLCYTYTNTMQSMLHLHRYYAVYATLTPILCYTYNDTMQFMLHLHRYYATLTMILCYTTRVVRIRKNCS